MLAPGFISQDRKPLKIDWNKKTRSHHVYRQETHEELNACIMRRKEKPKMPWQQITKETAAMWRPRPLDLKVWQATYEETLTNKDNQPIYVTQGDWIVEHPSGWIEKLTRQELDERYEPA